MVKAKGEEGRGEGKADGLEIISIGSLYNGPWDKKYWSSSRGKDRYPYPVGYKAIRGYNGSTYKMEIHEGAKGPLFLINSADGHISSGQTPDIAWEQVQKTSCPRLKILHVKRFSSKIDGVEFFGFKNPFVQRLLRELVANVNRTSESSLLSSSFCNKPGKLEDANLYADARTNLNLLSYLAKPQSRKKRSRRSGIANKKLASTAGLKRPRTQDFSSNLEASDLEEKNKRNEKENFVFPSSSKVKNDLCRLPGGSPSRIQLKPIPSESKGDFQLESVPLYDQLREEVVTDQEDIELRRSTVAANNLSKENDRSQDTEDKGSCLPMVIESTAGDAPVPKDCPAIDEANVYAPDTLDFLQDEMSASSIGDKSIGPIKEGLTDAYMIVNEGLVSELHPEEETVTSVSNVSLSYFDLAGEAITKSMMTLLLPQAIPLLKKASAKEMATITPSEMPCRATFSEENNETTNFADIPSLATLTEGAHVEKEEMQIQNVSPDSVVPSFEHSKSVVLDSHDKDLDGFQTNYQVAMISHGEDVALGNVEKDTCPTTMHEQLAGANAQNLSVFTPETSGSKTLFFYGNTHMVLNRKLLEADISKPLLSKSEGLQEESKDLDRNLVHSECYIEKDLKNVLDPAEGDTSLRNMGSSVRFSKKDINVNADPAETGSSIQALHKVYTRNKVSSQDHLVGKYSGPDPPSESSMMCRNIDDNCVTETFSGSRTLLLSDVHHVRSNYDRPPKGDPFRVEISLEGQLHSSNMEKMTSKSKIVSNSTGAISQNSTLIHGSEDKDMLQPFDSSVLHFEERQAHSENEMVVHENLAAPRLSQKLGISHCRENASKSVGDIASSGSKSVRDLAFNNDIEGIAELVGCYLHPMPICSVLLNITENEIYICASCGLLINKKRTLFVYKIVVKEPWEGSPSFLGHTSVLLPSSQENFDREILEEKSGLQFSPDGQHLILLDSIKTPNCRQGIIDCSCSTCMSDCFLGNAVKIVQVKHGHVSVVTKLKTVACVRCILVCNPSHLIAGGDNGRLHLWVMNSTWSAQTGEFVIPVNHSCIVELKRIPRSAHLVIGHNGFGEFSLWDISKRVLVSTFSTQCTSVYQFFPVSLFSWHPAFSHSAIKGNVDGIMVATKMWFSEFHENSAIMPTDGEDIAIWLLVCTPSDPDAQQNCISSPWQTDPARCWRLALLVKDVVIFGSALDPSAIVASASSGHGIIGTQDGLVYMWELSTGTRLGTLHDFKGSIISCIATDDDDSEPGVLGIGGDDGKLLVYRHSRKVSCRQ